MEFRNFTVVVFFFFMANSLYCSSAVKNDKTSLTSTNFSLNLLYTYPLHLEM